MSQPIRSHGQAFTNAGMPAVSVVIPSFNCADYISAAINSVLHQTMQDFELIIVDDGSVDATKEVVEPYLADPRISYIHQVNKGLPGARNTGALASKGTHLAFLDADDSLAPNTLATLTEVLSDSEACWCVIDLVKVSGEKREVQRTQIPGEELFYAILRDDFIRRGMFFTRQAFMEAGMYDEEMKNREDWELNIRMLELRKAFVYVPEPLYLYSWREGSITTGNPGKMLFYTERLLRKHHKRLADAGDPRATKIYAENMWGLARLYFYRTRNLQKALKCVWESFAYDMSPRRLFHPVIHRLQRLTAIPSQVQPGS